MTPVVPHSGRNDSCEPGYFRNPVLAGDRPDPSVLKDGKDYYLVNSTFEYTPGLLVWHSRDLVHWQPIGPALNHAVPGSVWAPDLVKHGNRYYIYFPVFAPQSCTNMVVWADDIRGPWSEPIDLKVGHIDPGHAVGPDGKRWLFLSGGHLVPLADDGLSVTGPVRKVYDGWQYPADWIVECFAQEGPKVMYRGGYYYMVLAEGGTAGPATSHMVVMARSKNLEGPWENSPFNPVSRTRDAAEKWWSRGHATLVEGPDGKQWYFVYHGYEKGYHSLGRQTLLEPVEWTEDGWVRGFAGNIGEPMRIPAGGEAVPHGIDYSDDFSTNRMGVQWAFFRAIPGTAPRHRYEEGALVIAAQGSGLPDCSPLCCNTGDRAYEVQVEVELRGETAEAALVVFYDERLFAGIGSSKTGFRLHGSGRSWNCGARHGVDTQRCYLRLRNDNHIITTWVSSNGRDWLQIDLRFEVSGYNHNTSGGFLSLRPALCATGQGDVAFRNFRYTLLPSS